MRKLYLSVSHRRPWFAVCVWLLAISAWGVPRQATASEAHQQRRERISVSFRNASLAEVLQRIKQQTGYYILYNSDAVRGIGGISFSKADAPVREVLDEALRGTRLECSIDDDTIVIRPRSQGEGHKAAPQKAPDKIVSGRVTDTAGAPLVGVNILVQGTGSGVVSGSDGGFSIRMPEGRDNLIFSYIGYVSQTLPSAQTRLVRLVQDEQEIENVVVTGIFTRKKESYTGSATTITSSQLARVSNRNVFESLKNIEPSLYIMDNTLMGSDPNTLPDMQLRGITTFPSESTGVNIKGNYQNRPNQPLFILDGFETTLETVMNLNMNRVASVTLLKDAASTAIYGSKASNGVVVIETKAPERGRLQLSYKGDFSVTMADLTDYNLMNSSEKLQFETLAGVYKDATHSMANQLRLDDLRNERLKGIARGIDTYWLNEPLRTGFTHKHNIYAEGGEEKIRYGIGLSYGEVQGVMKGSDRQTIGGNIDLIYRTGKFQFSNKLTLDYQKTNDPAVSFSEYAQANPYFKKYNDEGKIDRYLYYYQDPETLETEAISNPLWNAHLNNYDKGDQFGFTNNFIIEWFVMKDFRVRGKFGITHATGTTDTRLSPLHTSFDDLEETEKGLYTHSTTKRTNYEGDLTATYGRVLAEKHMLNAVAGFNFNATKRTANGYKANGFTDDQFGAPSFANGYPEGGKSTYSESQTRAASFYLNGGYSYDNRYLLDFNYRSDGASMFGTNNRFRNTWSVGIGTFRTSDSFATASSSSCSNCAPRWVIPATRISPPTRPSRPTPSTAG